MGSSLRPTLSALRGAAARVTTWARCSLRSAGGFAAPGRQGARARKQESGGISSLSLLGAARHTQQTRRRKFRWWSVMSEELLLFFFPNNVVLSSCDSLHTRTPCNY